MPIRKRNLSRRQHLDSDAQAWLDGRECHFFQFKPDDELAAIWQEHGDSETMYWTRGMSLPITLEELKANESAWLNSGVRHAIVFYRQASSDDEKQALWDERGDKKRFHWRPGMRRPEPHE